MFNQNVKIIALALYKSVDSKRVYLSSFAYKLCVLRFCRIVLFRAYTYSKCPLI